MKRSRLQLERWCLVSGSHHLRLDRIPTSDYGWFQVVTDGFRWLWVVMGYNYWVVMGGFEWLWVIMGGYQQVAGGYRQLQVVSVVMGGFEVIMDSYMALWVVFGRYGWLLGDNGW